MASSGEQSQVISQSIDDEQRWTRWAYCLMAACLAWRVLMVLLTPLELAPDEAYYWDWSRQLDWGYYSKPPMIAWLMGLMRFTVGSQEWALRLPAAILGAFGLPPVFWLTRAMYGSQAGCWAIGLTATTLGAAAAGMLMTIDAPFLCAWAWMLWAVWQFSGTAPQLVGQAAATSFRTAWCLAVLATGLGFLSKQTMVGAVGCAWLCWLAEPEFRRRGGWAGRLAWTAASLAFLAPVMWWNAQHGWITVQHTREHFGGHTVSVLQHVVRSLEFAVTQLGVLTPITGVITVAVAYRTLWVWPQLSLRERYLLWFGPIPLVAVLGLSLLQRIQPNWPAAFYISSLILVAGVLTGRVPCVPSLAVDRLWLRRGVLCGGACCLLLHVATAAIPQSPLAGSAFDPLVRLRGWQALADSFETFRQTKPDARPLLVCATNRTPVSPLAYYLPDQPRVYRWNPGRVVDSQHEIWSGPPDAAGRDAWILTGANDAVPTDLAQEFEHLERVGELVAPRGNGRGIFYTLWYGERLRAWPSPIPQRPVAAPQLASRTDANTAKGRQ